MKRMIELRSRGHDAVLKWVCVASMIFFAFMGCSAGSSTSPLAGSRSVSVEETIDQYLELMKAGDRGRHKDLNISAFFAYEEPKKISVETGVKLLQNILELRDRNPAQYDRVRSRVFREVSPVRNFSDTRNDELLFFRLAFEDPESWVVFFEAATGQSSQDHRYVGTVDRRLERAFSPLLHRLSGDLRELLDKSLVRGYESASKETYFNVKRNGVPVRNHNGMGPKRIFDTYFRHAHKPDVQILKSYFAKRSHFMRKAGHVPSIVESQQMMGESYEELIEFIRAAHGVSNNAEISLADGKVGTRMADYSALDFYSLLLAIQSGLRRAEQDKRTARQEVSLLFGGSMARGTATLGKSDIDGYFKVGPKAYFADLHLAKARQLEKDLTQFIRREMSNRLPALKLVRPEVSSFLQVSDDASSFSKFVKNLDEKNLGRINPIAFEVTPHQICLVIYSVPFSPSRYEEMQKPEIRVFSLQSYVEKRINSRESKSVNDQSFQNRCHTQPELHGYRLW